MTIVRRILIATLAVVLSAPLAHAQVQTGSITGMVTDASGAILPGVSITLTGERLIGGPQTQVTDTSGTYRFDRLVPGSYNVKFELQGFRTVDRPNVIINASFVATINGKMEVGQVSETITVTGESPTVDVRSNVQQTVMNQEILEGIPTGRDPWSLAKLIPGVQVATYDVGGTQSMQQSSMSSHGSNTADVSYNIDGATVNWPGGGGGATMIYYDQGMFEEVNYMTSAIPAEMMAGGVSINMVTKDGGNQWRGRLPYNFSNQDLQSENWAATQARNPNFRGNPTLKTYDLNVSGGGALITNLPGATAMKPGSATRPFFGIDAAVLPRTVTSRYAYGDLVTSAGPVPLTVVTGDQSAVPFAFGPLDPAIAYVNLGTGAFAQRAVSGTLPDAPRLLVSVVWSTADRVDYLLEGTVNGAASALDWLAEREGAPVTELLGEADGALAARETAPLFINGVSGLGAPFWVSTLESRFIGTGSRGGRVLAVLESIAFLLQANLEEMRLHGPPLTGLLVTGGLSASDYLCRCLGSLSNLPVTRTEDPEATARGLARLVAGEGASAWSVDHGPSQPPVLNRELEQRYRQWRAALEQALRP